jgi:hypothetical protein
MEQSMQRRGMHREAGKGREGQAERIVCASDTLQMCIFMLDEGVQTSIRV